MSVKTAEYMVSGLPFLCNDCVLGTQEIIEDFGVGVSTTMESVAMRANYLFDHYNLFLERAQHMHKHFSTERVSSDYKKLYANLMLRA